MVISMQWVYMRYLSLSWKWTQATWMGMFESQLRQSQKSPHSLEISLKHFMNERLVQSSPCPERVDGGSFYKDCPPCLQRERWEGIAPPPHFWKAIIWGYEILSYCDHEGGPAAQGLQVADGRSLSFPWHCGDAILTMGPPTFGFQNHMGT